MYGYTCVNGYIGMYVSIYRYIYIYLNKKDFIDLVIVFFF